ncbi:hypothetical protein ACJX0J_041754, partial [Zea mays]
MEKDSNLKNRVGIQMSQIERIHRFAVEKAIIHIKRNLLRKIKGLGKLDPRRQGLGEIYRIDSDHNLAEFDRSKLEGTHDGDLDMGGQTPLGIREGGILPEAGGAK